MEFLFEYLKYFLILFACFTYVLQKFYKYKQNQILVGDNITHFLFHNLFKNGYRINPEGIVGDNKLNLPIIFYSITSKILPKYTYHKNFICQFNLFLLTVIEMTILILLLQKYEIESALIYFFAASLIPSLSFSSFSEAGSYSKFSERLWALLANGAFIYLFTILSNHSSESALIIISTLIFGVFSMFLGKFSRQVIVFFSILILFLQPNLLSISVLCFIFIFTMFVKSGREEIIAQLEYLKNYKVYQSRNFEISELAAKKYLVFPFLYKSKLVRTYMRLISHSGLGVLFMLPTALYCFNTNVPYGETISIIAIILAVLTTTHFFYFVGSGDRYMFHILTIPAIISIFYGPDPSALLIANIIINFLALLYFSKQLKKNVAKNNLKIEAYEKASKLILSSDTVFFDHYKDAEIYQLLNGVDPKRRISTTKNYKWDEKSLALFKNYPFINKETKNLSNFGVTVLITNDNLTENSNIEFITNFEQYNIYRVRN